MSWLWPRAAYAEEQAQTEALLLYHVNYRALQTGSALGLATSAVGAAYRRLRHRPASPRGFAISGLRATGIGAVAGVVITDLMLVYHMWGREQIEWDDRAWRIRENKGQVEVDQFSLAGAALGGVAWAASGARRRAAMLGWRSGFGAVGLGSLAGTGAYMIWRHGIHGGKWEDDEGKREL